jgi:hypothetical protein
MVLKRLAPENGTFLKKYNHDNYTEQTNRRSRNNGLKITTIIAKKKSILVFLCCFFLEVFLPSRYISVTL